MVRSRSGALSSHPGGAFRRLRPALLFGAVPVPCSLFRGGARGGRGACRLWGRPRSPFAVRRSPAFGTRARRLWGRPRSPFPVLRSLFRGGHWWTPPKCFGAVPVRRSPFAVRDARSPALGPSPFPVPRSPSSVRLVGMTPTARTGFWAVPILRSPFPVLCSPFRRGEGVNCVFFTGFPHEVRSRERARGPAATNLTLKVGCCALPPALSNEFRFREGSVQRVRRSRPRAGSSASPVVRAPRRAGAGRG